MLLSKLDLIILFRDSPFGSGNYNHVLLSSILQGGIYSELILRAGNTAIFGNDSVDYSLKSKCCPKRTPVEMGRCGA